MQSVKKDVYYYLNIFIYIYYIKLKIALKKLYQYRKNIFL